MMMYLKQGSNTVAIAVALATGLCANEAFAFGSLGGNVDQLCAQAGNALETQFQPQLLDNCTGCHNDGNGGSGAGKTAYLAGDAAMIALFCPPASTPPPAPAPEPTPTCTDADGDGFSAEGGACGQMDCNDGDAAIHPGATELCTDGVDNNCNNLVDTNDPNAAGCPVTTACTDADADGYAIEGGTCGPVDCDDADPAVNPGAMEICDDGFDNNCDASADAVDAACQAMTGGTDETLQRRHHEAREKHRHHDHDNKHERDDHDDDDDDHHDRDGDGKHHRDRNESEEKERD